MTERLLDALRSLFGDRSCDHYYNTLVAESPEGAPTAGEACREYRKMIDSRNKNYFISL